MRARKHRAGGSVARVGILAALSFLLIGLSAPAAQAAFGLNDIEVTFTDAEGEPDLRAGSHPFAMTTSFAVNTTEHPEKGVQVIDGALRDLDISLPTGFAGNPTAVSRCPTLDFLTSDGKHPSCADSTAVGILTAELGGGLGVSGEETVAMYNMHPAPGVAAKLGFEIGGVPVTLDVGVNPDPPYNVIASLRNTSQIVEVLRSDATLWGNPADPDHDADRGLCAYEDVTGTCSANISVRPFITLPRSCTGPLITTFEARSWWSGDPLAPGPPELFEESVKTDDGSTPPSGIVECSKLGFDPTIAAQPTSRAAQSPTGLDFSLDVADQGLDNPKGLAKSDIRRTVVTLPEGMTVNPAVAEGLEICTPAQLDAETASSTPGVGCPNASKIGTVEVETPLLEGTILKGSVFQAQQDDPGTSKPGAENPFDTLIALYVVIKDKGLGIVVKQPLKVVPDPATGQIETIADDMPQLPFSHFRLHFREGGRSPLITPPSCGTHEVEAVLTPWSGGTPLTTTSAFEIVSGPNNGSCPPGGKPPFEPGFDAGTLNNSAGTHSPFLMRLTRRDGDQDLVRFDATLPPGVVAKLAGVEKCSDAAIASIESKTGREELANPSCPPNSKIGTVRAGAGVGSQLTYVPGSVYLAGPVGGAPLSVVGVVPAVAGPFDVGVVSTRQALTLDPVTAEVQVDGSLSEPIPHILAGIPLAVRDIRVNVDRPEFTLNPTNCDPMSVGAAIWGGGGNAFSLADDSPVGRSASFQAADCAALGFSPRLDIRLRGGTKRGGHPALQAVLRPRPGDANLERTAVRLPRSAFLDQAHIRTICTRVQFAVDACPAGAVYGRVRAFTPLLEQPLEGPAYLRSSSNNLPDLVFDLRGVVNIEASARIDSVRGGIRATFDGIPDAPVSKVVVNMAGGEKGLIVNSRNLCTAKNRAEAQLAAHNGRSVTIRPKMKVKCGKKRRSAGAAR